MTSESKNDEAARDARRIAGGFLCDALRSAGDLETSQRLEVFTEIAFAHLAPTGVSWLGFYRVDPGDESMSLVICRDRPACSPIGLHGVCGQSARSGRSRIVADVLDLGADYVACDPRDRSEIVVPLRIGGGTTGLPADLVLDLDSFEAGRFSDEDDVLLREALGAMGLKTVQAGPPIRGAWPGLD